MGTVFALQMRPGLTDPFPSLFAVWDVLCSATQHPAGRRSGASGLLIEDCPTPVHFLWYVPSLFCFWLTAFIGHVPSSRAPPLPALSTTRLFFSSVFPQSKGGYETREVRECQAKAIVASPFIWCLYKTFPILEFLSLKSIVELAGCTWVNKLFFLYIRLVISLAIQIR